MNKSMKPSPVVKRAMTEEELLAQRTQIYLQKREQYALNAGLKLLEKTKNPGEKDIVRIVNAAAFFADTLLEKLFTNPEGDNEDTEGNNNEENQ